MSGEFTALLNACIEERRNITPHDVAMALYNHANPISICIEILIACEQEIVEDPAQCSRIALEALFKSLGQNYQTVATKVEIIKNSNKEH